MNPIQIACPKCHRTYKIEEKILGKKVTCATEGCGTKFIAEAPPPTEETAAPTRLAVVPSTRPPSNPPESSNGDDDPFADFDLEALNSAPIRQPAALSDDDFIPLPPPLPKRRTAPSARVIINDESKSQSGGVAVAVLTLLCIAIVGVSAWIGLNFFFPGGNAGHSPSAGGGRPAATANPLAELHYLTDSALRLMQVSDDASLVQELIDQWAKQRSVIPKSDETEVSLGVIEGHLSKIYDELYASASRDRLSALDTSESTLRWMRVRESYDSIRSAQTQLMHAAKLPWIVAQRTDIYDLTYSNLRDEVSQVAADSEVGTNNLPPAISSEKYQAMVRRLDSLFAKVPYPPEKRRRTLDEFSRPFDIEFQDQHSGARSLHSTAVEILTERTRVPVSQNTLESKTEILRFSEHYKSTLSHLNSMTKMRADLLNP